MATPGELIQCMAGALGMPESTIVNHDRLLHQAGLRTKGGRGRSAARVTPRDVAHLLTAVLGSAQIKDTVDTIRRYELTRAHWHRPGPPEYRNIDLPAFIALSEEHNFIDALEAVFASAVDDTLRPFINRPMEISTGTFVEYQGSIYILACTPQTLGSIRIHTSKRGAGSDTHYVLPTPFGREGNREPSKTELEEWERAIDAQPPTPDLEQNRRISVRTVRQLARMLTS